jgi:hypothetical protein
MITAYAVMIGAHEQPALVQDRARANLLAAQRRGTVHKLVEQAAILRKFDGYVPADQASSMRFRIVELEEVVRAEVAERGPLLARIRELEAALQSAHARLQDMLMDDDGQAWKEARRALPAIAAALPATNPPAHPCDFHSGQFGGCTPSCSRAEVITDAAIIASAFAADHLAEDEARS